jgi:nicotinate-nucleotide adenylyltransferase
MGGTFDPIHLGHLRAAENARESLGLDVVAFVPSGVPPHRPDRQATPVDRYVMACLATAAHPDFTVWSTEVERPGPSFTVDTLAAARSERPEDDLILLVGSDTWPEMTRWHEPERLFSLAEVAVVDRPGEPVQDVVAPAFPSVRGVIRVEGPGLDISATDVRERVHRGLSVRYLVPVAVAEFIERRRLYS